jgi:hypothetical protein
MSRSRPTVKCPAFSFCLLKQREDTGETRVLPIYSRCVTFSESSTGRRRDLPWARMFSFTQTESLHASTWIHLRDCHGQSQMHVVAVLMLFKNHRRPSIYSGVWAIDKIGFSEEPSLYQRLERRVIGAHSAIDEAGNNRDRIATCSFASLTNIGFSFGPSEGLFFFLSLHKCRMCT